MNYEKLTVQKFSENLKEGKYASLTGARRAIGKVQDWTGKQRDTARALADKHFEGVTPPVKSEKVGKKGKKIARKAGKKETSSVEAPLAAVTVTETKGARKPAPKEISVPSSRMVDVGLPSLTASQIAANPQHAVGISDRVINSVATAVQTATLLKQNDPNLDISEIQECSHNALRKAVAIMDQTTDAVYAATPTPSSISTAFGKNNGTSHLNGSAAPPAPAAPSTPATPPAAQASPEEPAIDPHEQELFNKCADAAIAVETSRRTISDV